MPEPITVGSASRAVALESAPVRVGDGRTVSVRLVRYGVTGHVSDDHGRSFYDEVFAAGSVRVEADAPVYREVPRANDPHLSQPVLVGRIIGYRSLEDGCYAEVRISASAAGADLLADMDDRIIRHVSIEFDAPTLPPRGQRATGPIVHTDALVRGLLFTNTPQSPGADILGRRSTGDIPMSETPVAGPFSGTIDGNIDGVITVPDPVAPVDPNAPPVAAGQNAAPAQVAAATRAVPSPANAPAPAAAARRAAPVAPATRFRSFGEFAHACSFGAQRVTLEERALVFRALDELQVAHRALDQADLTDVTGLLQTQWIGQIVDLMREYTPAVNAFASSPLPEKGMTIARPVVITRPLVGLQSPEAAPLPSRKVEIGPSNVAVNVYGGGQSMTIGTMQRTEPSYLDAVMRLYAIEMAVNLETTVAANVLLVADDVNTPIELAATDADIQKAFTAACVPFLNNLNRLPEFALINTVLWLKMANATGSDGRPLYPTVSPFNPAGSVSLQSPDGQVRDLPFRVVPKLGGATSVAVVGVPEAYETMVGNTQTLQADDPETLVHQLAVFEFAAFGPIDAAGLQLIVDAT